MSDYKSRLIIESKELMKKLTKLRAFNSSDAVKQLDEREQRLLAAQQQALTRYYDILETRLAGL